MAESADVAQLVVNILDRRQSFVEIMTRNMSEKLADQLTRIGAIDKVYQYYTQTNMPIYMNLLRAILGYASSRVADVEALFKLANVPELQESAMRNLEAASI